MLDAHRSKVVTLVVVVASLLGFVLFGPREFENVDFVVMYAADLGAVNGIDPYDEVAQNVVLHAGFPDASPIVQPFGYPPWYPLTTLWLAALPVDAAGRLWLLVNCALMIAAVALASRGETDDRERGGLAVAAIAYIPVIGLLSVGQFTAPLTLGAALLAIAPREGRHSAVMGAVGLVLLTFKPHIGALIAVAAVPWLVGPGRPALLRGLLVGGVLAAASFAISPRWPIAYPASAVRLLREGNNVVCDTCSSATVFLARSITGGRFSLVIAGVLVAAVLLLSIVRKPDPTGRIAIATTTAVVVLPYLRNYDNVLLIVPMVIAWGRASRAGRGMLALAWLLPVAIVFVEDRATGVHSLWVSACLVLALLFVHPRAA